MKLRKRGFFLMKEYAIIVAGGSGSRMKNDTPKQFIKLEGKPILLHTIEAFFKYSSEISIILVLPSSEVSRWAAIEDDFYPTAAIQVAEGGISRFQSVKNGLSHIGPAKSLVAIHDGVRPLVQTEIIRKSFQLAHANGCAVASTPLKESLRRIENDNSQAMPRTKYRSIQTPQTFKTDLIKSAYNNFDDSDEFTDDASVAEKNGQGIFLFEGSYENIKITTPEDLLYAEAILKSRKKGNELHSLP